MEMVLQRKAVGCEEVEKYCPDHAKILKGRITEIVQRHFVKHHHHKHHHHHEEPPPAPADGPEATFERLDTNHNGRLSREEFGAREDDASGEGAAPAGGGGQEPNGDADEAEPPCDEEPQAADQAEQDEFKALDKDGNGALTREEFGAGGAIPDPPPAVPAVREGGDLPEVWEGGDLPEEAPGSPEANQDALPFERGEGGFDDQPPAGPGGPMPSGEEEQNADPEGGEQPPSAEDEFKRMDKNGDEVISKKEFMDGQDEGADAIMVCDESPCRDETESTDECCEEMKKQHAIKNCWKEACEAVVRAMPDQCSKFKKPPPSPPAVSPEDALDPDSSGGDSPPAAEGGDAGEAGPDKEFDDIDTNKNGEIDQQEWRKAKEFDDMDKNKNGEIDQKEFTEAGQEGGGEPPAGEEPSGQEPNGDADEAEPPCDEEPQAADAAEQDEFKALDKDGNGALTREEFGAREDDASGEGAAPAGGGGQEPNGDADEAEPPCDEEPQAADAAEQDEFKALDKDGNGALTREEFGAREDDASGEGAAPAGGGGQELADEDNSADENQAKESQPPCDEEEEPQAADAAKKVDLPSPGEVAEEYITNQVKGS
eukprot:TRINITY_DN475_c0_g1_i4.p1 TRINITY_DN475_c0_g1~~TRINITY_DN475_c0_g1_i4.p1  ORF type:complete len:702 (+),score=183.14 TRINITY_DN475_c0_g1_i4:310-2106(+)